jgi:ketosteroid isomerase-like protein
MSIEADVLALSDARDQALVANDADAVAGYFADDWVYVVPTGPVPKADIIGWIGTGRLAHYTMDTVGEPRVVVYGDTVIVTARQASSGAWEGVAYTADEWITDVFVRRDGQWTCVLSQKCDASPGT